MHARLRTLILGGCLSIGLHGCVAGPDMSGIMKQQRDMETQQKNMMDKVHLMQEEMSHPDLPQWHDQRDQMAFAVGDRQLQKGFDRVFDSMITALANLGCRVQNIERTSGYISASIPELPPDRLQALQKQARVEYAVAKGYPPDIWDRKNGPYDTAADYDPSAMMSRTGGLTLSMVKQDANTTKVKLRFDNVYYPGLLDEYYKVVWQAIDKQMFLDQGLD